METPHLPRAIFGECFERVYEPAEDSFLLMDALEADLNHLRSNTSICIECGSGSGAVITALSKAFGNNNERIMIATDINLDACQTTRKCANYHGQNNIQVIATDLAESLVDKLAGRVDLLIFNPPYVPTDDDDMIDHGRGDNKLQLSWAGGLNGTTLSHKFLRSYLHRLLSPTGCAYLVALDRNNIKGLLVLLIDQKIMGNVVLARKAGIEHLFVIKYERQKV